MEVIVALDAGTTGITAIAVDRQGHVVKKFYREITQHYPKPGWVEHDAEEIWMVARAALAEVIAEHQAVALGITNQRETVVAWDNQTGRPLHRAIVWQCRRTEELCRELRSHEPMIRRKTGLVLDPYFSATKMTWLLQNVPSVAQAQKDGRLAFGTVDSWLVYNLTGNHHTDFTNASRTMLLNIRPGKQQDRAPAEESSDDAETAEPLCAPEAFEWDEELLDLFGVPAWSLPAVLPSIGDYGRWNGIPVAGVAGDQQAALVGQLGLRPGSAKNTYGTGCFLMVNTGAEAVESKSGLITTLCCGPRGIPAYALEGSVFVAGAVVQWLRDGLGLIKTAQETEELARRVKDTQGVYLVPAFVGLGAPYWDAKARGAIVGITRGVSRECIVAAALQSIAYQTRDLIECVRQDTGSVPRELKVDGKATSNNYLMQFQADILGIRVSRPENIDTTSLGAAFLAGLALGFWKPSELLNVRKIGITFEPRMPSEERERLYAGWKEAVERVRSKG